MPVVDLPDLQNVFVQSRPFTAGSYIYRAGAAADAYYFVRSGVVKTCQTNSRGDELVTGFHYPSELVGCSQMDGVYADSGVVLETATVCALPDNHQGELYKLSLNNAFLHLLAERETQTSLHQRNLSQTRADARLAGWLVQTGRRLQKLGWCQQRIPTPMSRTDLANYLGMTIESLSRVTGRFEAAGWINATRAHLEVLNPSAVAAAGAHMLL